MAFLDGNGVTTLVNRLKEYFVTKTGLKTVNNDSLLGSGNVSVQPTLVSGTNIKTVNNTSLLGSGNVAVQPTLVSGTNIKTINNNSLLGSGNLTIEGGGSSKVYIGTSDTAAATSIKVVTCEGFTLEAGAVISVKFQYGNSASTPRLNVNGTGAKYISEYGAGFYVWREYSTLTFFYDGTNYVVVSRDESHADVYSVLCNTQAGTASKDISAKYMTYNKICLLAVTFTSGSTSDTMSLNVGDGNSRLVYKGNSAVSASNPLKLAAKETAIFTPYGGGYIFVAKANGYLPRVTASDNGKVLAVVNGEWAAATASGGGSSDAYDLIIKCNGAGFTNVASDYQIVKGSLATILAAKEQNTLITGVCHSLVKYYDDEEDTTSDVYSIARLCAITDDYSGQTYPGYSPNARLVFVDFNNKKRVNVFVNDEETILNVSISSY